MGDVEITVESVLGTHRLRDGDELTLGELLAANRLPETLFQAYSHADSDSPVPIPLATPLSSLDEAGQVVLRLIRNTLLPTVLPDDARRAPLMPGVGFRSIRPGADGQAEEHTAVVDSDEARRLVGEQVVAFEATYDLNRGGCVLGISGGGDSNALAYGLRRALASDQLQAFTLVFGAVFSEQAAVRAALLCQELEIAHRVLTPRDIEALLRVRTSLDDLYADFADSFSEEALHFFGTFLILRCARRLATTFEFTNLAFGYNREDLLAEALFMLMNGNRPLAFPVRPIGQHRVVMPVWRVPKLLLDACHPRFSLENYRERDPFTTRQRSLAFFLAHSLDSAYPAFGLSLLEGLSKALDGAWGQLTHDTESDLFLTAQAEPEATDTVRQLLDRHFG